MTLDLAARETPLLPRMDRSMALYEKALLSRLVDEKMSKLSKQNKGGSFHLFANGHELVGAAFGLALKAGTDWGLPYYRDRAFAIGLGCELRELFGAFLAREVPHHSGGRMMPDHFSHKALRIPCQSSVVGSQFLQAAGVALGIKLSASEEVVYVSAGDGATSQGDFHEALNFAALNQLPLIFVIQDNGWAISVPVEKQTAGGCASTFAAGYSGLIETIVVDGTDIEAMEACAYRATEHARFKGPVLVIAKVPRLGPHSSSDDPKKYKTEANFIEDTKRDPLLAAEAKLVRQGIMTLEQIAELKKTLFDAVEKAALEGDLYPHPSIQDAEKNVFAPSDVQTQIEEMNDGEEIVIMDAINHALKEAMEEDDRIVVFGQDVAGGKGGVFGITRELTATFGESRCFNSTLAESTIIGVALGLSIYGYRPVVEIQFCDYMWTCVNQLFNEVASYHYRSAGEWNCPIVIRMPYGGYIQGGPYHSQCIEAHLCHIPGLKVLLPSTSSDAKALVKAAIEDPNPVIILEHKALYRQRIFSARKELTSKSILALPASACRSEGEDVTLLTWSYLTSVTADICRSLREEGIFVEHIDLLSLSPLDIDAITASVKKTGKLIVVHEAAPVCGFGAELLAQITETCFEYLDAPPVRITGKMCPIPYAKPLEDGVLPQKSDIAAAIRKLANY